MAIRGLEKYLDIDNVECKFVVSGTNHGETKVFFVNSDLLKNSLEQFETVDFCHIYSIVPCGISIPELKESEPPLFQPEQTRALQQKSMTDYFDTSFVGRNVAMSIEQKPKEQKPKEQKLKEQKPKEQKPKEHFTQMSLKAFFPKKKVYYTKGAWFQKLIDEFEAHEEFEQLEDLDFPIGDDETLLRALHEEEGRICDAQMDGKVIEEDIEARTGDNN